ncbi:hypothetical protein [Desulfogranum japonicum]|uniref:hypothetical protein n=1 Tax=Desulfogranum japonicum TaxID=231447 RepID=UPI0012947A30|nr:hypothetical protein [Desulfogranum japonicum]
MNILFYTAGSSDIGSRFRQSLEHIEALESVTDCWNYHDLRAHFEKLAPLPEAVVLYAASSEELESFSVFRPRLDNVFFILVLPDDQDETIAKGHLLRPRFLAYKDEDFSQITAVLQQLMKKQQEQTDAVPGLFPGKTG